MSERKEFEEWLASSCSRVDVATHHAMWTAWQAALASRWRSMESAPVDEDIYVKSTDGSREIAWLSSSSGLWISTYMEIPTPLAWHPLPDPPTPEELENLK